MKSDVLFWAICDLDEDLILNAKEDAVMTKKNMSRTMRRVLIAAIIVILLVGSVFAVSKTKIGNYFSEIWTQRDGAEMTQTQQSYLENRSADIGEMVTVDGVSVTVDSVTCTTDTLYYVYTVDFVGLADAFNNAPQSEITAVVDGQSYPGQWVIADRLLNWEDGERCTLQSTVKFDLPEGTMLGNAAVSLSLDALPFDDFTKTFCGPWNFEFTLPECEEVKALTVEKTVEFDDGTVLTVSDISLSEGSVEFCFTSEADNVMLLSEDAGDIADMEAADPGVQFYVFAIYLADGTQVPISAGVAQYNEDMGRTECAFYLEIPVNPEEVVSLVFTDGKTQQEIVLR